MRVDVTVVPEAGTASWQAELSDVYGREFAPMTRLAYLMTRDPEACHDIAQEAFCRLGSAMRAGDVENPGGYVRTTVVRMCIDRGASRTRAAQLLERLNTARPAANAELSSPESRIDRTEMWAALESLTLEQRAAIVLRFWLDMPLAEIAALCECPVATINSRLRRGLLTLRKVVER